MRPVPRDLTRATTVERLASLGRDHEDCELWDGAMVVREAARGMSGPLGVRLVARLAEFVDLFPTLTDLCGLPLAGGLEGISLAPLLDDPNRPWKKAAFTVVTRRGGLGRAVRTETHTLLVWPDGSEQLYDHARDAKEYDNLALDTRVKQTADSLRQLLKAGWQAALP